MSKVDQRVPLTMTVEQIHAIDEWRRQQPDIPQRAPAIRRLIDIGLGAERDRGLKDKNNSP